MCFKLGFIGFSYLFGSGEQKSVNRNLIGRTHFDLELSGCRDSRVIN